VESEEFDQTGLTLPMAKRTLEGASETELPERGGKWTHSYDRRIKFSFITCIIFLDLGFPIESYSPAHIPRDVRGCLFFACIIEQTALLH
jgi:hypothetical protein